MVNNEVVALGTYENGDVRARLLLTRFNNYGNVKGRVVFDANKATFGYHILYDNHQLFIVGLTNASHFLIDTNNISNKIFVLRLSLNYEKEKIVFLHNGDNSNLVDACMANGMLYIQGRLAGTGEYDTASPLPMDSIFAVSCNLDIINHKAIVRRKFLKIACNEDGLYVFGADDKLNDLTVEEYDYFLNKRNFIYLYKDKDYSILDIVVGSSSLHEPVSCSIVSKKGSDYYNSIISIDLELDVIHNEIRKGTTSSTLNAIYISNGYYYLFTNMASTKDVNKFINIKEIEGFCYANGIYCPCKLEEINEEIYGTYKRQVTYLYNDLNIVLYQDYEIPIKVSIKDHSVYDRKIQLTFNGIGYLNNEKIESGYIVTKEGQYVLEVRGKSESKFYTFEVKTLVIAENDFSVEEPEVVINKTGGTSKSTASNNDGYNSTTTKVSLNNFSSTNNTNYYILIGVGILGLIIGLFIPLNRIMKKGEK